MATSLSPRSRERLIECAKQMTECAVTGDREAFLDADKMFDEITEETCPNPFISQALASLQSHSRRYWFATATQQSLESSVALHVRVIRALLKGDGDEAEKEMMALVDGFRASTSAVTDQ
jgi:DNA-binding FadR family transcriptional regulator